MTTSPRWPLALLAALVVMGLAAHTLQLVDWSLVLAHAREHAEQWWFAPALVLLQVLLFTFALPGAAVLWIAAPLFAPVAATAILTSGGVFGALAAYAFAQRLAGASLKRVQASRGYQIMQREGNFLALCALRVVPGVPHSVLNYGAGVLRLPLLPFAAAAAVGFGLKAYLYSSVIHRALEAGAPAELLSPATFWPLVALAAVLLLAHGLRRWRA